VSTAQRPPVLLGALATGAFILAPAASDAAGPTAAARFKAIYTAEYAARQGTQAPDENARPGTPLHLPDVGPKAQAEKLARLKRVEKQLAGVRFAELSRENRINYAVYKAQIDALLASQLYRDYEKPFNADSSFWGDVAQSARGDFSNEAAYREYLKMLREIPRYYDQQIANMRAGLARGFTAPKITVIGRDAGVAQVAQAATPQDSPFYAPFRSFPASVGPTTQAALKAEAVTAIREAVVPAHARLLTFLRDEYLAKTRTSLAAYDLPDGKAYYRSKIREFVTLDLTPEQIHATGLAEVASIRAQMLEIMQEVGFKGDLSDFLHFLRTDPQFYAKTPQDLLDRAAWIAKMFDGKASMWFGRLPRSRFGIKPVPAEIAPFYTGGRGGPGVYLVNTYKSACASALFPPGIDAARERARPRFPDAARRREQGAARLPSQRIYLGLW